MYGCLGTVLNAVIVFVMQTEQQYHCFILNSQSTFVEEEQTTSWNSVTLQTAKEMSHLRMPGGSVEKITANNDGSMFF